MAEGELWSGINGLTADQASLWGFMMKQNPDIRATINRCDEKNGTRFCWLKMWAAPASPPTPSEPPATVPSLSAPSPASVKIRR